MRFFYFLLTGLFSFILTAWVIILARKWQVLDIPDPGRKKHLRPTPLLGGLAVGVSFLLSLGLYLYSGEPDFTIIPQKFFLALAAGIGVLMAGGVLDDKYGLPPKISWLFPAVAGLLAVSFGIGVGIKIISNPLGGVWVIDDIWFGVPVSGMLAFCWLLGMTFTTKLLDGLDGLVTGVGIIGALTLGFLSLTPKVNQPMTAMIAIILAGSLLGFLIYNFNPAKIFLGEAGSTLVGYILGVIAIILGGKMATAILVMGIPILDIVWVIFQRIFSKKSPFIGDRQHLHFKLLEAGLSQKQVVLIYWTFSALFGFTAVFLQSKGKLIALIVLALVMLGLILGLAWLFRRPASKHLSQ